MSNVQLPDSGKFLSFLKDDIGLDDDDVEYLQKLLSASLMSRNEQPLLPHSPANA